MTPHRQTIVADPARGDGHDTNGVPGDCWRTAIACLLDLHPLDVPHFVESADWWGATKAWAAARGDDIIYLPLPVSDDWREWWDAQSKQLEHVILGGPSPRGSFGHVVVGTPNLVVVHDPHPSDAGLSEVKEIFVYMDRDDR